MSQGDYMGNMPNIEPTLCIAPSVEILHQSPAADGMGVSVVTLRITFGDESNQEVYLTPEAARELAESLNRGADDSED